MTAREGDADQVIVLGFDGLPWNLVRKWADDGTLPGFARIRTEGASGPLSSTIPPETPLAWPSISTGVWPDAHGIYAFRSLKPDYGHELNTSGDVRRPALWRMLTPAVVGNVPMTYPAAEIDGSLVAGMMTPRRDAGFTHPPDLADEIADRIPDYTVGLDWSEYRGREEALVADLADLLAARRDLMRLLLERADWRLFYFVYTAPDRLQHLVWDEAVLVDFYRRLDDVLAEVVAHAEERGATLYVVSDHGFGPIERCFYPNRILESAGFLTGRADNRIRGHLHRLGLDKDDVLSLLGRVGIDETDLVTYLPQRVLDAVATSVPGSHGRYDVDFGNTIAFVHGPGNLYINDEDRFDRGVVDGSDVPAVKAELTDLLESATDPATGMRPIRVRDGDELYESDDFAPDLVVCGRDGYTHRNSLSDHRFAPADSDAGYHEREGIFFAWGPTIEAGTSPVDATVVDVAPTALHGAGEPIPRATDGRVLDEIFAPDSDPGRRAPITATYGTSDGVAAPDDDFDDVENRLEGLGYLE